MRVMLLDMPRTNIDMKAYETSRDLVEGRLEEYRNKRKKVADHIVNLHDTLDACNVVIENLLELLLEIKINPDMDSIEVLDKIQKAIGNDE